MIVNRFLDPDPWQLVEELKGSSSKKFRKLNKALAQLVGVNPLTHNIKEQILLSCSHTFLIKVLGRTFTLGDLVLNSHDLRG